MKNSKFNSDVIYAFVLQQIIDRDRLKRAWNLTYFVIDVVSLLVTGNIHGCFWSAVSSKLSVMWSGLFVASDVPGVLES